MGLSAAFDALDQAGLIEHPALNQRPAVVLARAAIQQACTAAALAEAEEVLISAHGTGTPLNDKNEPAAIRAVFGAAAMRHPVIATKSAHGHLIGGSAALQAVIALQDCGWALPRRCSISTRPIPSAR